VWRGGAQARLQAATMAARTSARDNVGKDRGADQ
jgi:hypothetical protein